MIILKLTSACAPHPEITFYLNGNFTVTKSHNANRDGTYDTVINDGGWHVQESPEDINWEITKQLEVKGSL